MSFVNRPHAFIFVSIFVVLDSEPFFAIISPVTYILRRREPFIAFDCSVLFSFLFLNPENGSMSAILLCLCIIAVTIRYNK
jgi:hypothetical protein